MKIKTFILTFLLMMMSSPIVFGQSRAGEIAITGADGIEAAIEQSINNGGTQVRVCLMQSFEVAKQINIPEGANVYIDLNNFTLSSPSDVYIFKNLGTLEVEDKGTYGWGKIESKGIANGAATKNGKLIINSGTFTHNGTGGAIVYNYESGEATIYGGTFKGGELTPAIINKGVMTIAGKDEFDRVVVEENGAENKTITCFAGSTLDIKNAYIYGADVKVNNGATLNIGENVMYVKATVGGEVFGSLKAAVEEANNATDGNVVELLYNTTESEIVEVKAGITINGNDNTMTSTAEKAINFDVNDVDQKVVINDLKIATTNNTERAINVVSKSNVELNNVTAEGFKYTINVPNAGAGCKIATNGGKYSGYAAVNITAEASFKANATEFVGINNVPVHESNNFAVIAVNTSTPHNVSIDIDAESTITAKAENNRQYILTVDCDNSNISIAATLIPVNSDIINGDVAGNNIAFDSEYEDDLTAQGYAVSSVDGGMISVDGYAIAMIDEQYYTSLADAYKAVTDGQIIQILAEDKTLENALNYPVSGDEATAKNFTITTKEGFEFTTKAKLIFNNVNVTLLNADINAVLNSSINSNIVLSGVNDVKTLQSSNGGIFSVAEGEHTIGTLMGELNVSGEQTLAINAVGDGASLVMKGATLNGTLPAALNITVAEGENVIKAAVNGGNLVVAKNTTLAVNADMTDLASLAVNGTMNAAANVKVTPAEGNTVINGTFAISGEGKVASIYRSVTINGIVNVNGGATFTQSNKNYSFNLNDGAAVNVAEGSVITVGMAKVAAESVVNLNFIGNASFKSTTNAGTIKLYMKEGATFTTNEIATGLETTTDFGCKIFRENGAYIAKRILNEGDVAMIAETEVGYPSLQAAIDACTPAGNNTIVLLSNIEETSVEIDQNEGINITIDGGEETRFGFSGTMYIHGKNRFTGAETLTIKNINFYNENLTAAHDFISCNTTDSHERYAHNVTVENCNFTGVEGVDVVAMRFRQCYDIKVVGGEFTNLHSVMWTTGTSGLEFDGINAFECKNGMHIGGASKGVVVKKSSLDVDNYGIRAEGPGKDFKFESTNIIAKIPVVVRNVEKTSKLNFTFGENTMNPSNQYNYWFVAGTAEYEGGDDEELPEVAGQVIVNIEDPNLSYNGVYGHYGVAKIGNARYQSLKAAAEASVDGDEIELLWQDGQDPISMEATFVGNKTVTITGTANVDWDKGWLYVGRNGEGNGKVIFKNANLTSKSVDVNGNGIGLNVSCNKEDDSTINDGKVEIINSNIELDYLIGKGNIKLNNSTLNVYEGFAVGAHPASETGGEQRTVTMDITNGSKVIVDNHNGQGLGYEFNGIMNIDSTSTFEAIKKFRVTAMSTMNLAGIANAPEGIENLGTINMTKETAKLYTPTTGLNINADVEGYKAIYYAATDEEAAHYTLLSNEDFVFAVTDAEDNTLNGYTTFPAAIDAAEDGQVVVIKTNGPINFGSNKSNGIVGKTVTVKTAEGIDAVKVYYNNRNMLVGNGGHVVLDGVKLIPYEADKVYDKAIIVENGATVDFINGADVTACNIINNGTVNVNASSVNVTSFQNIDPAVVNVVGESTVYVKNNITGKGFFNLNNVTLNAATKLAGNEAYIRFEGTNEVFGSTFSNSRMTVAENASLTLKGTVYGGKNITNNGTIVMFDDEECAHSTLFYTPVEGLKFENITDHTIEYNKDETDNKNNYYYIRNNEYTVKIVRGEQILPFETLAEALAVVEDNDNVVVFEDNAAPAVTYEGGKSFSISTEGDKPQYRIPFLTIKNGNVTIENANDLRSELVLVNKEATVTVKNSELNFIKTQVNGVLNITSGATFNTGELLHGYNSTVQYVSNKEAQINVNENAQFTIGSNMWIDNNGNDVDYAKFRSSFNSIAVMNISGTATVNFSVKNASANLAADAIINVTDTPTITSTSIAGDGKFIMDKAQLSQSISLYGANVQFGDNNTIDGAQLVNCNFNVVGDVTVKSDVNVSTLTSNSGSAITIAQGKTLSCADVNTGTTTGGVIDVNGYFKVTNSLTGSPVVKLYATSYSRFYIENDDTNLALCEPQNGTGESCDINYNSTCGYYYVNNNFVAEANGTKYVSIAAAQAALPYNGGTIKLLKSSISENVEITKAIIFEANDVVTINGTLTLKSTLQISANITATTITISDKDSYTQGVLVVDENKTLIVTTLTNESTFAGSNYSYPAAITVKGNLTANTTFTNSGTMNIESVGTVYVKGTLNNTSTITVNGTLSADASNYTTTKITNSATINIYGELKANAPQGSYYYGNNNVNFTNNAGATVQLHGGKLSYTNASSYASSSFTNNGTVKLNLYNNKQPQINIQSNVNGEGNFEVVSNGIKLDSNTKLQNANIVFTSGTSASKKSFTISGATLKDSNLSLQTYATLNVENSVSIDKLDVLGAYSYSTSSTSNTVIVKNNAKLTVESELVNKGTISIEDGSTLDANTLSNNYKITVNGTLDANSLTDNSYYSDYSDNYACGITVDNGTLKVTNTFTNNKNVLVKGTSTVDVTLAKSTYGQFYMRGVNLDHNSSINDGIVIFVDGANTVTGTDNYEDGSYYDSYYDNPVLTNSTVSVYSAATLTLIDVQTAALINNGNLTLVGTVKSGAVTGNGSIAMNNNTDKFYTSTATLDITTEVADSKVVYNDGGYYEVIAKDYVAQIVGGSKYESIQEAVEAAEDNSTIVFLVNREESFEVNKPLTFTTAEDVTTISGEHAINSNVTINNTDKLIFGNVKFADNATFTLNGALELDKLEVTSAEENVEINVKSQLVVKERFQFAGSKATLNLAENGTLETQGTEIFGASARIKFNHHDATYTTNDSDIVSKMESGLSDHKVSYKDGQYKLIGKYVAVTGSMSYETFAEALKNVEDGGTIELLWEEGNDPIVMAGALSGKDATVTGPFDSENKAMTATVDWSADYLYIGRGASEDNGPATLTFSNANFTSLNNGYNEEAKRLYGIHVSGFQSVNNQHNSDGSPKFDGTLVIDNNSDVEISYLVNRHNVEVKGQSKVTLINETSMNLGGRPAKETHDNAPAKATLTISENSTFVSNNIYVGYEGIGEMTVDAGSSVEINDGKVLKVGAASSNYEVGTGRLFSSGNITGLLEETAYGLIELKGGLYTIDVNEFCHEDYSAFPYDEGMKQWIVRLDSGSQEIVLNKEWNWISSYMQSFDGKDGLNMLKNSLLDHGIQIKSQTQFTTRQEEGGWSGSLEETSYLEMYKVKTDGTEVKLVFDKGSYVDYDSDEAEIVLYPGWNYIGYPVSFSIALTDALDNLTPSYGDVIKSHTQTSVYEAANEIPELGVVPEGWNGTLDVLDPGQGYMYYNAGDIKSFNYSANANVPTRTTVAEINKHWNNTTSYPSNMTIVAMVSIDGEIVNDNYEVAAFANGELRGSARPVYIEAINAYVLYLTIQGEDVEELTFKYYDVNYGTEYKLNNRINYSNDAIVGSISSPYMLNLDILNIDEAATTEISIYPNPTTTNVEINLNATCDTVEVFNALGVKVAEYSNVDSIDALETAGVYVIRITNDGNVQNCRLVVK